VSVIASLQKSQPQVNFASNLTLRTLFCSVFIVVVHAADCDKYRCTEVSPYVRGGLSQLLFIGQARHRSTAKPAIADDPDLCLPQLQTTLPLGESCRTIGMAFDMEKVQWFGLPMMKKIQLDFVPFSSYLTLNNIVTFKSGLEITEVHQNWYHLSYLTALMRFPIQLPRPYL